MKLTGAEILLECLLEQQVDTVFGYPGGAVLNIYDALYQYADRIRHIRTAHEQGAAHAADGYARSSGKTGVCIATSGPGATNLVTGLATAYMDSVPMVAITGNVARPLLGLDSFQEVDITGITMPVTKHNFLVREVGDLADTVREAFAIAQSGRKGPVLIDIPKDVTAAECEYTGREPLPPEDTPMPSERRMKAALELLMHSERPFIYAGGGVILSEAAGELHRLAAALDAPVACSLMCQGGYDQYDGRYVGMLGMHGTKTAALALHECDLLVAIGTRFSDRVTCNAGLFAKNCKVLHIDIDTAEFGKNVDAALRLRGNAREILAALLPALPQREHGDWMARITRWQREYPLVQSAPHPDAVTPKELLETLDALTGSEAILTTEVGQHQMWAAQFYRFRRPRQFITSGGLGTMGFGLGAAMGAQLANPGKQVVNIAGDGSFLMNANELSTAARYNIPLIELILNNGVLGMVRQWQKLFYENRFSHTTLEKPVDYELLAKAYGVPAYTIAERAQIEPVLRQALGEKGPVLVNCLIDMDQNVLPMVPAGAPVEDIILEM
ncbi:biosynthetic-type acetolactate synthase large subunit [Harryflintia acetispora]|uniref:Acetolactate synthase n=1 Tax=Harryflintia acetispora TaxID=1849041 RepID=A0A9X8Y7E9_9FIRM|nr:biosynthetic-type acetolactate synthase large subunit [Harryflintia acetispora]TCL42283.1 acetolactate synthase large subunit [Harryflintia acetispora]